MRNTSGSDSLVALAAANERTRVAAVLAAATELFAQSGDHGAAEILQFSELTTNLIGKAEEPQRRKMATLLASHPQTPHALLERLARDVIAVAAPVLCVDNHLTAGFLITLIEDKGPDHALALAKRPGLDGCVIDAIAESGSEAARLALIKRGLLPEKHEHTSETPALPTAIGTGATNDAALIDRFLDLDTDSRLTVIADLERETARGLAEGSPLDRQPAPGPEVEAALMDSAAQGDGDRLAALLASVAGVESKLVGAILEDRGGEAFALVLAAAGIKAKTATGLILLANPDLGNSADKLRALSKLASQISTRTAWRILGALQQNRDIGGHQPLTAETRADARAAETRAREIDTRVETPARVAGKPAQRA